VSIRRQCELLCLNRSTLYYAPAKVSAEETALMKAIDRIFTKWPFYGSRKIARELCRQGQRVNRKRVQRLMRIMGLQALVPGPHTSKPHPEHKVYPYLLRRLAIDRPNQVWAADITYIPLESGWGYLIAIIDWHSRAVLSWRLSNTMTADFCIDTLKDALRQHGKPEIFNSDQGAQFTSPEFTDVLQNAGVAISMDGKGRATDNIFVERLWRSLKYEDVYIRGYATLADAQEGIANWMRFYNHTRPHQGLGNRTPMDVYRAVEQEAAA
jgi:putative transposase